MPVFFKNLNLMEFPIKYLALFHLFSVIDRFRWFWMTSFRKTIQLMLDFLKAHFLVEHFSWYTLVTFFMILSVILLYIAIRHPICGNHKNWFLNLNLIYERQWTGAGSGLLISMPEKTQLVLFDQSNNAGAIDVKMDGFILQEKSSFKMLALSFFFKLDCSSYIMSIAKTAFKNIILSLDLFYEVSFSRGCSVSL